ILPGLEVRHVRTGERHSLADLGVAPMTRRPKVQREAAEAANLDALALRERVAHDLENLLQRQLDVLGRQVLLLGSDYLDELRLGHALRHKARSAQRSPEPICSFRRSPRLLPPG